MKVYTVEDLETFEKDECGYLICPTGDYSQIESFNERCSFGEWCSFGECCSFGGCCSFGEKCNLENNHKFENINENVDRVLKIDRIGSRKGCTYFFKTINNIYVRCGCFFGTITKFEEKVKETHADNEQYRNEYLKAIEYVKSVM